MFGGDRQCQVVISGKMTYPTKSCQEKFKDTKVVIKSRNLKDRPYNGQRKKDKKTNNDRQNTTQKTKDGATQTPLLVCYYI